MSRFFRLVFNQKRIWRNVLVLNWDTGGILVDEQYQTSKKDIYAVGDAIVVKQQITNEDTLISLASPANRQGRQVADVCWVDWLAKQRQYRDCDRARIRSCGSVHRVE